MTCEEEPEISISKTHELAIKAQMLMRDIERLLDSCTSTDPSTQRLDRTIQQECQASTEQEGKTLVIDGIRFESEASQKTRGV